MKIKNIEHLISSILLSMVYVFIIKKLMNIYTKNTPENKRIAKIAIMSIIIVIIGIFLALRLFNTEKTKDIIIKDGLIIGSSFIFLNSILFHWSQFSYNIKLFIIGFSLCAKIILLSVIKRVIIIYN